MAWTDEKVEVLKKLWADGLSASQIAGELGDVTRNAVIGKVHRLGLSGRVKPQSTAPRRPRRTPSRPSAPRPSRPRVIGNTALKDEPLVDAVAEAVIEPFIVEELLAPSPVRVSLVELNENTCRWPIGDPGDKDFHFCGRDKDGGGGPYCKHHARVAYHTPTRRKSNVGSR